MSGEAIEILKQLPLPPKKPKEKQQIIIISVQKNCLETELISSYEILVNKHIFISRSKCSNLFGKTLVSCL